MQKSLLNPVLTTFSEALVAALSILDSSHSSDDNLKTQVPYLSRKSEQEPAEASVEPSADPLL
jgi:hypothetical protein